MLVLVFTCFQIIRPFSEYEAASKLTMLVLTLLKLIETFMLILITSCVLDVSSTKNQVHGELQLSFSVSFSTKIEF